MNFARVLYIFKLCFFLFVRDPCQCFCRLIWSLSIQSSFSWRRGSKMIKISFRIELKVKICVKLAFIVCVDALMTLSCSSGGDGCILRLTAADWTMAVNFPLFLSMGIRLRSCTEDKENIYITCVLIGVKSFYVLWNISEIVCLPLSFRFFFSFDNWVDLFGQFQLNELIGLALFGIQSISYDGYHSSDQQSHSTSLR